MAAASHKATTKKVPWVRMVAPVYAQGIAILPAAVPFLHDSDDPTTSDTASAADAAVGPRRAALRRGAVIGRYVVIDRAGEGGMGVVYKAYDPELERPVALKLLHAGQRTGEEAERRRARLVREARALARLNHPNVVTVHDVGAIDDDVFIATEFVEGAPLKSWVLTEKPSVDEVLRVMIAAGEGLAAAHRAGLVHRDVKPGNLFVGKDGRARVLDFGLARADASDDGERVEGVRVAAAPLAGRAADEEKSPASLPDAFDAPLTRAGQVVGTPRYMAAEQHMGRTADARSDQFSYCATLYEALYGDPPFEAGGDDYRTNVIAGRLRAAPADARVPRWLRQVLERGLAPRPEDRWPSMDALIAELRRDRTARRRRTLWAVGVAAAVVAAAGGAAWLSRDHAGPVCAGAEAKLAGVWDPAAKSAVAAAFTASGAPGAREQYARVEHVLDGYAERWTAMRTEACTATRVRAEQSEELLDLRMECLDERLGELRAQVQVLAHADGATVGKAAQAAGSLAPLDGCADAAALRAPMRPPADAGARERVDAVRARLAEGKARQRVGGYVEARAIATAATDDAATLGYRPLEAESLFLLGDVQDDLGDYKAAERTMVRAATAAIAGRHDEVLARALTALVAVVGLRQARFEEAHAWAALAGAAADRGDAFVRGEMRRNLGRLLYREGKFGEARAEIEACLAVWRPALGEDAYSVAGPLTDLGNAFYSEGDYARAIEQYERSIAVLEKSVGPDSALLGPNLNNMGEVALRLGRLDRAFDVLQRALDVWSRGLGPEHPKVALARFNLGELWRRRGDLDRARAEYERALAIDEKALGPDSPETAYAVEGIGDVLRDRGDLKGAIDRYERVLAIREKALGPTHVEVADTLTRLGQAKLATGDTRISIRLLERALSIRESQRGDPADLEETRKALERARGAR
jgi:tetratricopeptide (TPR) repeat protein/tRNA A-37 threonylcarbamoyl transferase component Bud32